MHRRGWDPTREQETPVHPTHKSRHLEVLNGCFAMKTRCAKEYILSSGGSKWTRPRSNLFRASID
ncbi:hypothetical protein HPB50_004666 [Hyalomma asiaticum]|uniref:Uncharacterized protein n=1 Tax=Hyalomma asiaticum TaxID=266040 RepID=A0ACB7RHQ0_HYAAI|nr:hypothetical protein HPB50_004666 [Hyalomma asiaticum]